MPTLAIFIQHSFGNPNNSNQRKKTNKRNLNCKGRSKIHCLQTTLIQYGKNPRGYDKITSVNQ